MTALYFAGGKKWGLHMEEEEVKCKQCNDTGWADVRNADGSVHKCLCYCHPLVKSGKIKALGGSYYLTKYIKLEQSKSHKTKRGKRNVSE